MKSSTKHHHTGAELNPEAIRSAIETFLASCRCPAVLEYGDELLPLLAGRYALEIRSGRLAIEAWDEVRSVSRRILSIDRNSPGILDCTIQKFAGQTGTLTFLDTQRPQTAHRKARGERSNFAEQFRRMLARQYPGWEIEALSTGMDLQRSLSPVYPRARLKCGQCQIAAMACPSAEAESGLLTFALLWFDHVSHFGTQTRLCLFLPDGSGALTAHRLRWLNRTVLKQHVFLFNGHGSAGEVDPEDLGNVETRVSSSFRPAAPITPDFSRLHGVGIIPELNGNFSLRCRGVEFARFESGRYLLGLGARIESSEAEVLRFAEQFAAIETATPAAERWLECALRRSPAAIHPDIQPGLLHGQVLTFAGLDRDIIDLLGITRDGRLLTIELKTEEDMHLPLQALDYWARVRWHLERRELGHLFPGVSLRPDAPSLLLVAPALNFHPAVQTVLRYFARDIHVERIGVNAGWQNGLEVVTRLRGAASPQSQRNYGHYYRNPEHQKSDLESEP